jgi:hypothetical protein
MKIGLVDVDGHNFPNLCLMKLSAWHKAKGDEVEFSIPLMPYDRIYMARVFDDIYTHDDITAYQCTDVRRGGTGYGLDNTLPYEVEHTFPDYSLYGIMDTAYGFLTRGCPRGCEFCIVGRKEGRCSRKVADLSEFWNGQKNIKLLDPNIIACQQWKELLQQLIDSKAKVDFTQGVDIRLMTEEKAEMLTKIDLEMIHFAWDNYPDDFCYQQLKRFRPLLNLDKRKLGVYVLTNFNTTLEQDLERIYKLRSLDYTPYLMIYNKPSEPKELLRMQRWVNNKIIWRSAERFEDYKG